jgi:hypothetical protein
MNQAVSSQFKSASIHICALAEMDFRIHHQDAAAQDYGLPRGSTPI